MESGNMAIAAMPNSLASSVCSFSPQARFLICRKLSLYPFLRGQGADRHSASIKRHGNLPFSRKSGTRGAYYWPMTALMRRTPAEELSSFLILKDFRSPVLLACGPPQISLEKLPMV